jgi:MEMO1 family protein
LASSLVADALTRASGDGYTRVVIVGPNHDDRGPDVLSSSAVEYDTPAGVVLPDEEIINYFRTTFFCHADAEVFVNEHSVGAIVPFVAEAFPHAKIIPIIISSRVNDSNAKKLADWLAELPLDTLVIFSVDFSHYKTQGEADVFDKETAAALARRDASKIEGWGNEHIDSPFTIATMIYFADKIGANINVVANKNANDFLPQKVSSTTSYFEIVVKQLISNP